MGARESTLRSRDARLDRMISPEDEQGRVAALSRYGILDTPAEPEFDRITALATELRKLGAEVEERRDGLTITPRPLRGCAVDTYNDHRMAMSLALVGLRVPGVVITDPGCVAKTYPGFWQDLEELRG